MTTLPACCIPSPEASLAETLYCEYQRGGPPERAGLAWDGRPCPTWAELQERSAGNDAGARGVIAKWEAVAESVRADSASDADEVKAALEQLKTDLMEGLDKAKQVMVPREEAVQEAASKRIQEVVGMVPIFEVLDQPLEVRTDFAHEVAMAHLRAMNYAALEALAEEVDSGDPAKALEMAQALERKIGGHPDVTYYKVLAQRILASGGEE